MAFSLVVPESSSKKNTSKDVVLSILSYSWPLTAKTIHKITQREYGLNNTYQATHKVLNELLAEGVVRKDKKNYELSNQWINSLESFTSNLKESYEKGRREFIKNIYSKESFNLPMETTYDFAKFLVFDFYYFPNPKKKPIASQIYFIYNSVGLSREIVTAAYTALRNNCYCVCRGDAIINKLFSMAYADIGVKLKLGVDCASNFDTWVVGDYILNVFWTKNHKKIIKKVWYDTTKFSEFNLNLIYDLMFKKMGTIELTVTKNPAVAERLRQQTIEYFK